MIVNCKERLSIPSWSWSSLFLLDLSLLSSFLIFLWSSTLSSFFLWSFSSRYRSRSLLSKSILTSSPELCYYFCPWLNWSWSCPFSSVSSKAERRMIVPSITCPYVFFNCKLLSFSWQLQFYCFNLSLGKVRPFPSDITWPCCASFLCFIPFFVWVFWLCLPLWTCPWFHWRRSSYFRVSSLYLLNSILVMVLSLFSFSDWLFTFHSFTCPFIKSISSTQARLIRRNRHPLFFHFTLWLTR